MTEDQTQRKLTAILSADVQGYTRLMGEDEELTVNTITLYRQIFTYCVEKHHGQVVDSPGDNILAQFNSTLDAVNSAVDIQQTLEAENEKLPRSRRMNFRIGINLGDIIHKEGRIYGDGVNVAARIEGLADPGGVCVSRGVYEQVKKKIHQGFEYMGEHTVKNVSDPVRIYRILLAREDEGKFIDSSISKPHRTWKTAAAVIALVSISVMSMVWFLYPRPNKTEPASVGEMIFPLPEKPSIAVLPFNNMSGDPEQDYFVDGLTEEIITALSKVPQIFVIARNSVFSYKNKPVKAKQVSEELGVRYVLEGSIRKAGNQIRITAQLIDALTGQNLWAERYDRNLKEIFAVQDDLTKSIITAMQVELTEGEQARVAAKGTNSLQAYLKYLQAREQVNQLNLEGNALGRQLAAEAINLDPKFAMAYRVLAETYRMDVSLGVSDSPEQSIETCVKFLQKAISLDAGYAEAYGALGFSLSMMGRHGEAVAKSEQAVTLDPNSAEAHVMLAHTLRVAGRAEEAIAEYHKAIRLNPIPPSYYLFGLGMCYSLTGQHDTAIKWCEKAIRQDPDSLIARLIMTVVYSLAGRDKQARAQAAEVLRINPRYSLAKAEKRATAMYKDVFIRALRKAGLK